MESGAVPADPLYKALFATYVAQHSKYSDLLKDWSQLSHVDRLAGFVFDAECTRLGRH